MHQNLNVELHSFAILIAAVLFDATVIARLQVNGPPIKASRLAEKVKSIVDRKIFKNSAGLFDATVIARLQVNGPPIKASRLAEKVKSIVDRKIFKNSEGLSSTRCGAERSGKRVLELFDVSVGTRSLNGVFISVF